MNKSSSNASTAQFFGCEQVPYIADAEWYRDETDSARCRPSHAPPQQVHAPALRAKRIVPTWPRLYLQGVRFADIHVHLKHLRARSDDNRPSESPQTA